jgi:hypothetical protein
MSGMELVVSPDTEEVTSKMVKTTCNYVDKSKDTANRPIRWHIMLPWPTPRIKNKFDHKKFGNHGDEGFLTGVYSH